MKTFARCLFVATLLAWAVSGADAARYEIDAVHASVGFKVRHMVISKTSGVFGKFSGWFDFDPKDAKGKSWKTETEIEVASVDTGNGKRDAHLRSADFFDVENHPKMIFRSTKIERKGDDLYLIGDLTLRGTTKTVRLTLESHGTVEDQQGNLHAGFTATGKINRQDFGVSFNKVLETGGLVVDNTVEITLEIEGIEKK